FSPEGGGVRTEVSFSSWEGKQGDAYGFSLRTLQDGRVVEDLHGKASLERPGSGGVATYTRPEGRRLELPPGTLFPVAHTRLLIREALAGSAMVMRPGFLGQREDEPMHVNALISPREPRPQPSKQSDDLLARPSWQFHLAFYGPED